MLLVFSSRFVERNVKNSLSLFFSFANFATMLSTKGKPAPLPSSPLLSSKLKQASLDDNDEPFSSATTNGAAAAAAGEERQEMKQFWEEHSKTATVEEMMLDSKASEIDLQERPEVREKLLVQ